MPGVRRQVDARDGLDLAEAHAQAADVDDGRRLVDDPIAPCTRAIAPGNRDAPVGPDADEGRLRGSRMSEVSASPSRWGCSLKVSSRGPVEPTTTRVTDEFTSTVLNRLHSRAYAAASASGSTSAAHTAAIVPPEVTATAVSPGPARRARGVERRRVTRARKAGHGSAYSPSWPPPVQRAVAQLEDPLELAPVEVAARRVRVRRHHAQVVELVPAGVDDRVGRHPPLASAVSRCRRMPPRTTAVGVTPRSRSQPPSRRPCSQPVSDRTS